MIKIYKLLTTGFWAIILIGVCSLTSIAQEVIEVKNVQAQTKLDGIK